MSLDPKLKELIDKYDILLIKRWEGIEKSAIYILVGKELTNEEKKALEAELSKFFDLSKYAVMFFDDLHPSQLKQVLEKYETLYVGDKSRCDSIIAGILVLGHDFRFFVNEKMNIMIKKRLKEILPNF